MAERLTNKTQGETDIRVHRHHVGLVREIICRNCDWGQPDSRGERNYQDMVDHVEANPDHEVWFRLVDHCAMTRRQIEGPTPEEFREMTGAESNRNCRGCGEPHANRKIVEAPGGMPVCQDCHRKITGEGR